MVVGMRRRETAMVLCAWLAVVGLGAGLVWFVIGDAGRVVSFAGAPLAGPAPADPVPKGTGIASPTKGSPTPAKHPPKATPTQRSTAPATTAPAPVDPTPRPSSRQPRPRHPATKSTPPKPRSVVRTWSGTGGSLTVSCRGRTIRLKGATPDDGWRVERGAAGPTEVEVTFEKDDAQVQVQSHCSGGTPVFRVEREGSDKRAPAGSTAH